MLIFEEDIVIFTHRGSPCIGQSGQRDARQIQKHAGLNDAVRVALGEVATTFLEAFMRSINVIKSEHCQLRF